ncbi:MULTISPECIES: LuxR C-terminal-related transcriptional regulator [unclassified Streptomyces]|uniref:LuxR C-terminal-related transcriptional regulator n=1 Tax=unclassified Streptomyces TaxID=2593676 RepID=UPI00226DE271|nr:MULTISPECIES: LuxR C-terminal-related transcriptional regulator [unclassified Streptomyces]MCY0924174.1 LuxR C-terminal-related transcriptional regulator [Streptomyces sp. H27-G5]MCY0963363.1 LuxR C-terminal-related transcriptional regulator [Streptomyces sp. H27-H5]
MQQSKTLNIHVESLGSFFSLGLIEEIRRSNELKTTDDVNEADVRVIIIGRAEPGMSIKPAPKGVPAILLLEEAEALDFKSTFDDGVISVIKQADVDTALLVNAVQQAVRGVGFVTTSVLRQRLDPNINGHPMSLTEREGMFLALAADGYTTHEIARHMGYSERTVKLILNGIVTRYALNNRTHAVASALRAGLIR